MGSYFFIFPPRCIYIYISTRHVELRQTLMSVSANCHMIERLFFESSKTGKSLSRPYFTLYYSYLSAYLFLIIR